MPEADSTDLAADPSYAPSPSVSSDEGSIPLPASESPTISFPSDSDDDDDAESVPILSIADTPFVSTPSTTVFDRSVIPAEHGLLPVIPRKRDAEDNTSEADVKRHAHLPLPANEMKHPLSPADAAVLPDPKRVTYAPPPGGPLKRPYAGSLVSVPKRSHLANFFFVFH
ncbi:unnamed protein product [[Candida] boidinii]|uniref:Unnamed protein product n=1 Tax=Candida boidinii TaxID=5477 RepID=A0A9W6T7G4_CANBO|nr:unnamed protein product [[Candida] boidinii]